MFCPNCQTELKAGITYGPKCGFNLAEITHSQSEGALIKNVRPQQTKLRCDEPLRLELEWLKA